MAAPRRSGGGRAMAYALAEADLRDVHRLHERHRHQRNDDADRHGAYATASTTSEQPGTCSGPGTTAITTHGGSAGTAAFSAA